MTPEEQEKVEERVHQAYVAGQIVMQERICDSLERLIKWGGFPGSRPIGVVRLPTEPALDEDARNKLIERLTRGDDL